MISEVGDIEVFGMIIDTGSDIKDKNYSVMFGGSDVARDVASKNPEESRWIRDYLSLSSRHVLFPMN